MTLKRKSKRKSISIASRKAKARSLQQWVCEKISEITGYEYGKDKPIESRPMGQSGPDIRMEEDVQALFPFAVECKWQEVWAIHPWVEQAKKNTKDNLSWLLICKRSGKAKHPQPPIVVMDAEDFFKLYKAYIG